MHLSYSVSVFIYNINRTIVMSYHLLSKAVTPFCSLKPYVAIAYSTLSLIATLKVASSRSLTFVFGYEDRYNIVVCSCNGGCWSGGSSQCGDNCYCDGTLRGRKPYCHSSSSIAYTISSSLINYFIYYRCLTLRREGYAGTCLQP